VRHLSPRNAKRAALAVLALSPMAVGTGGVGAQVPEPAPSSTSTTVEAITTTTTAPAPVEPPPTSLPAPVPTTAPTAPQPPAPKSDVGEEGGDGDVSVVPRGVVPPEARRIINSVRRSPANNSRKLLNAAKALIDVGLDEEQAIAASFGRFPVGGYATFTHDWLFPRYTPSFHLHKGTDIFAVAGTPVRAPADGQLKLSQGAVGGLSAYVYQSDGTYYYMAHLRSFVAGQRSGQPVKMGDVVGYVGDSGNARGGAPHVHFEIHPAPVRGDKVRAVAIGTVLPAVDPKPYLDTWLAEAVAGVPKLLGSVPRPSRPLGAVGGGPRTGRAGRATTFPAPVAPPRAQLLWVSSASPAGGALAFAEAEAMNAATELDWSRLAQQQQASFEAERTARARSDAILGPITPEPLRRNGTG